MGNIFRAGEIVEMGIRIEENGRDFYRALSAGTGNEKARSLFDYLAGEEERHKETFLKLRGRIGDQEAPAESYPGEEDAYLRQLASDHVFTGPGKGEEFAGKVKSDADGVEMGIGFEKDSIVFFLGMKNAVPESDHPVIDELIAEEQKHLRQLMEMRRILI